MLISKTATTQHLKVNMKHTLRMAGMTLASIIVAGCSGNSTPPSQIEQQGYFRDSLGNRIYTVTLRSDVTHQDIMRDGMSRPFSVGQLTAVYYYPASSTPPRDGVTMAKNVHDANRVIFEDKSVSPWRYAFMRSFAGNKPWVVDCDETPADDLCRAPSN